MFWNIDAFLPEPEVTLKWENCDGVVSDGAPTCWVFTVQSRHQSRISIGSLRVLSVCGRDQPNVVSTHCIIIHL